MSFRLSLIAAASLSVSPALAASNPTFEAIFANGLRRSDDQFAAMAPVPALEARKILVPFTDGNNRYPSVRTNAFYVYEDGVLRLHVSTESKSDILRRSYPAPTKYWNEFTAYSRLTPAGSYTGSTALGARMRVAKFNLRTIKFAFWERDKAGSFSTDVLLRMDGPAARKFVQVAAVELTLGESVDAWQSAKCEHLLHSAELSHPEEVDDLTCVVRAPVQSIRIIRTDTGEELKSED